MTTFRQLVVGQTFDFAHDWCTFTDRCTKVSVRRYRSNVTGLVMRVGLLEAEVFHVDKTNVTFRAVVLEDNGDGTKSVSTILKTSNLHCTEVDALRHLVDMLPETLKGDNDTVRKGWTVTIERQES